MRRISIISIVTVILALTGFGCRNYSTEELVRRKAKEELRDIASDIRHVSEPVLYKKVSPKFIIEHQTSSLNRAFDELNRAFDSLDYYLQKKIFNFKEFNYNECKIDLDSLRREYDSIQSFLSKYSHDYIVYKVGYETKESVKDTIFVKYYERLKEDGKHIHLSASREDDDYYDTLGYKSSYSLFAENDSIKDIILKKKEELKENKETILKLLNSLNEKIINKIEIDTFRLQMEAFRLWASKRDSIKVSSNKD